MKKKPSDSNCTAQRNRAQWKIGGNAIWGDIAKTAMSNANGANINCGAQGGS
ncbi:hypothetical protein [Actinotignum sp. GS-2025b]|uniref:hypothetical protein n=1 Tax=Actinotignum sp. GS-2025b TaxID=3427275 RepID=UPI003F45DECE